ncbi:MAG TPA: hypothetical protein VFA18_23030 [Gemmataceae bacterium]|nr:hypothetical protein [Gemmataceae bacterium]
MRRRWLPLIVLALCWAAAPARAEHADIDLRVMRVDSATGESLAEASASADTEPPQGGLHPRPLFKTRINQPLVLQFFLTNRYPHGEKPAVRVRYFIVREAKIGQKNVPDLSQGTVTAGCFTLNMKPHARVGSRVAFTIKKPGLYLLRVQTENTDSDHEHFSAIDLEVK